MSAGELGEHHPGSLLHVHQRHDVGVGGLRVLDRPEDLVHDRLVGARDREGLPHEDREGLVGGVVAVEVPLGSHEVILPSCGVGVEEVDVGRCGRRRCGCCSADRGGRGRGSAERCGRPGSWPRSRDGSAPAAILWRWRTRSSDGAVGISLRPMIWRAMVSRSITLWSRVRPPACRA